MGVPPRWLIGPANHGAPIPVKVRPSPWIKTNVMKSLHFWGLFPSQDFRKVVGMFINPILGMFIHLSQLGLHQPLVLRFLFRCRKKKTHPRNKSKARNIPPDDVHPEDAPRVTCWPSCFALASSSRERTWRCFVTSAGGAAHGARGVMLESLDPPCLRILRWENLWWFALEPTVETYMCICDSHVYLWFCIHYVYIYACIYIYAYIYIYIYT